MPEPPDGPATPVRKDAFLATVRREGVLADRADPGSADVTQADPPGAPVGADPRAELMNRLRRTPGLAALVGEAVATWRAREGTEDDGTPGWRAFSDAFPTFWEFSNRPR